MRLKTQTAKKEYIRRALSLMMGVAVAMLVLPALGEAHAPGCNTKKCDNHAYILWTKHHPYTGFEVSGPVSTFGYLTGSSEGTTADGGTTARPCIAIRDDSTMDHWFRVTVEGHSAKLLHCDWGPAESTGRAIDITGEGDELLGLSVVNFPTEALGVAKELR